MVDPGLVDQAFAIAGAGEKNVAVFRRRAVLVLVEEGWYAAASQRISSASFAENEGLGMLQMSVAK
jgi:hypothetical protein